MTRRDCLVSVDDLSRQFGVSTQTIRRGLNLLYDANILRRRHGGGGAVRRSAQCRVRTPPRDECTCQGADRHSGRSNGRGRRSQRGAMAAETCPRSPRSSPLAVRRCGSTFQAAVMVSIVGAPSRAGLPGTNARKGGLEF